MALFPQPIYKWRAVSANTTAADNELLNVTTSTLTIKIQLPPVGDASVVSARKVDAAVGAFNLVTADGSTIDGVVGTTGVTTATTQHAGFTVASDGANWWVIGL